MIQLMDMVFQANKHMPKYKEKKKRKERWINKNEIILVPHKIILVPLRQTDPVQTGVKGAGRLMNPISPLHFCGYMPTFCS